MFLFTSLVGGGEGGREEGWFKVWQEAERELLISLGEPIKISLWGKWGGGGGSPIWGGGGGSNMNAACFEGGTREEVGMCVYICICIIHDPIHRNLSKIVN